MIALGQKQIEDMQLGDKPLTAVYMGENLVWGDHILDPSTEAALAKANTLGMLTPVQIHPLDNFIRRIKRAGIWNKLDLLYVFCHSLGYTDIQFKRLNLINPDKYLITVVGGVTSTPEGVLFNGSNSYLNTSWKASFEGNKTLLNSATRGGYIYENKNDLEEVLKSSFEGVPTSDRVKGQWGDQMICSSNFANRVHQDKDESVGGYTDLTGAGLKTVSRYSNTKILIKSDNTNYERDAESYAFPTSNKEIGRRCGQYISNLGVSMYFAGSYLTPEEQDIFAEYFRTYRQDIGLQDIELKG